MNFYQIKFSLSASADQTEMMNRLKSAGAEVIQTSSGLCLKSELSLSDLKKSLGESANGVAMDPLDPSAGDLSPDVRAFIGG